MNVAAPSVKGVPSDVNRNALTSLFDTGNFLELLVAIRGSALPTGEKMELRDAVLEYSQATDDKEREKVKRDISDKIVAHPKEFAFLLSTKQDVAPKNPAKQQKLAVRTQRATPVFKGSSSSVPTAPEPKPAPAPVPTASPQPASANSNPDPLVRIKEIKAAVNSQVGNPVNLMDVDNTVGREYMQALLEAMKKSAGGSDSGSLMPAMERLEKAYVEVEKVLAQGVKTPSSSPPAPTKPAPEVTPTPQPPTPSAVKLPVQSAATKEHKDPVTPPKPVMPAAVPNVEKKPTPAVAATPKLRPVAQQVRPASESSQKPVVKNHQPKAIITEPELSEKKKTALRSLTSRFAGGEIQTKTPPAPQSKTAGVEKSTTAPAPTPPAANTPRKPVQSVASVESLPEKMNELQASMDAREAEKLVMSDDLMAPEVTAGLEQLLSEWKLFKSSGFFGTGPGGVDHPMYKQISKLPMASVIAGRFEGATLEVKHSITDYMNGWRFEQGLVHEMGETFEHYLRRVILHILKIQKRQKQKNSA